VVATLASLGSHYDLSSAWVQLRDPLTGAARMFDPGSVTQMLFVVVVPQLLVWPVYTLVAGLVGAAAVALIMLPRRPRRVALPVEMKTAAQDR
jgi:hypothetical protein